MKYKVILVSGYIAILTGGCDNAPKSPLSVSSPLSKPTYRPIPERAATLEETIAILNARRATLDAMSQNVLYGRHHMTQGPQGSIPLYRQDTFRDDQIERLRRDMIQERDYAQEELSQLQKSMVDYGQKNSP